MSERFVIALRRGVRDDTWQERVAETRGVRVVGATRRIMQVEAEGMNLEALQSKLGPDILVEQAINREI
ncbi:hypothetical protein SAMN05421759_11114 [Roseivivax lentus]|uniref:Uncharacterized protein n=1 Tax=Roseivivax lentus TaxID=633194 RepID=A0A1N7NXS4_9RHOB|nr:hypothetical protein [Roseivivax lentus]SIT03175.1 hypothetical protein SAMN05421759_11114 [Roseivivax lentus]